MKPCSGSLPRGSRGFVLGEQAREMLPWAGGSAGLRGTEILHSLLKGAGKRSPERGCHSLCCLLFYHDAT